MREAAEDERYEDAARYRNRLFAIEKLAERQGADRRETGSIDVIGVAAEGDRAAVQVFPPGRQDGRPARLPPGERRGAGRHHDPRVLLPRVLRERALDPAAARRAARGDRARGAGAVPHRAARLARRGARAGARREAAARRARGAERPDRARLGDARLGAEAASPRRRARGAARGAQPGEPAAPDRVLRHLEHPGAADRRLDGRLPGRAGEEGALPQVRRPRARRAGRLRRDGGGRLAASRASAPASRPTTTRGSRRRRTWS